MLFSRFSWKSLEIGLFVYYERGGAAIVHPGPPLIACGKEGVKGGCAYPPLTHIQSMHAGFSFSYPPISLLLRQPLSIKKSYAGAIQYISLSFLFLHTYIFNILAPAGRKGCMCVVKLKIRREIRKVYPVPCVTLSQLWDKPVAKFIVPDWRDKVDSSE